MEKKYFTLDEANRLLPYIRSQIVELRDLKAQITEKVAQCEQNGFDWHKLSQKDNLTAEEQAMMSEIEMLADQVQDMVFELTAQGVLLKDIEKGLVDFYCLLPGEEVFLCWQCDEPEIQYFHAIDSGFSGRRSLLDKEILQNITQVH